MGKVVSPKIKDLSAYLPKEVKSRITTSVLENFDNKRLLAQKVGCSYPAVKKWSSGSTPSQKYFPKVLQLGLDRIPQVRVLLKRELAKLLATCKEVDLWEPSQPSVGFLSKLDSTSIKILEYIYQNQYAQIEELANFVKTNKHSEVLGRINKVINPHFQKILGKPILEFKEWGIDPLTGESITFSWWLTDISSDVFESPLNDQQVEAFNEGEHLTIVYSNPDDEFLNPVAEASFKNGLLSIKVQK